MEGNRGQRSDAGVRRSQAKIGKQEVGGHAAMGRARCSRSLAADAGEGIVVAHRRFPRVLVVGTVSDGIKGACGIGAPVPHVAVEVKHRVGGWFLSLVVISRRWTVGPIPDVEI